MPRRNLSSWRVTCVLPPVHSSRNRLVPRRPGARHPSPILHVGSAGRRVWISLDHDNTEQRRCESGAIPPRHECRGFPRKLDKKTRQLDGLPKVSGANPVQNRAIFGIAKKCNLLKIKAFKSLHTPSHGRGHRFEPCTAHQIKQWLRRFLSRSFCFSL